ncbi:hypothetical protein Tco_0419023 [Tanacetum coccineum]
MTSMNTRLNIKKLDGNIIQKHGGSKQVGFKQLGPGVETRVHGVHDEKRVWFEVELQGAQRNREAEIFQVSNDDLEVAQRWLEDKQPEEKTNTDCLVKEHEKEYRIGWKIKTGNAEDTTMSTYLVNRSSSSVIGFKTPIDTNIGFNKSGEYKKTFIGSGVGTGSVQVLQGVKFEVEPQEDHTFEVEPHRNVDHVVASQEVQTHDLIYYHSALDKIYAHELLTFNNTIACEVIFKWEAGLKDDMDARSDIYVLSNGCKKCSDDSDGYYWEYTPAKGNILGLEIIRDQGGNTLRMSQSRIHNEKLVQTLLKGHSTLSLEDSLSMECDVEKNGKRSYICNLEARSIRWSARNLT